MGEYKYTGVRLLSLHDDETLQFILIQEHDLLHWIVLYWQ